MSKSPTCTVKLKNTDITLTMGKVMGTGMKNTDKLRLKM